MLTEKNGVYKSVYFMCFSYTENNNLNRKEQHIVYFTIRRSGLNVDQIFHIL